MAKMTPKKMDDEMMPEDGCCGSGMGREAGCDMHGHGGGCGHRPPAGVLFVKFAAGVLMLLLAILAGMQIWGNPWYKNIRAEFTSQPYARTVTVEGDGKVTTKPDIARISLSVASTGKTVKVVTDDNVKKMNAVIAELKKLGIKAGDIQTSAYDLYPQYDYNTPIYIDPTKPEYIDSVKAGLQDKTPRIIGYSLNQTVAVKVRDLNQTDDVVDLATKAGANQVGSLMFDIDDLTVPKAAARKLAFDKAKAKASQMAGAAGVSLGKVVTFSEGYTGGYPVQYANYAMRDMAVSESGAPAPAIEPGSQEITVNVSVTYEIE